MKTCRYILAMSETDSCLHGQSISFLLRAANLHAARMPLLYRCFKRHLRACPQALHAAGLVHRDVKPANIIFSESARKFKLIDLGACADLRSGTNFIPDESILDPMYCPPEQVGCCRVRALVHVV